MADNIGYLPDNGHPQKIGSNGVAEFHVIGSSKEDVHADGATVGGEEDEGQRFRDQPPLFFCRWITERPKLCFCKYTIKGSLNERLNALHLVVH